MSYEALQLEPPFTEEVLAYSVEDYPFASSVCRSIFGDEKACTVPHSEQLRSLRYSHDLPKNWRKTAEDFGLQDSYQRYVKDVIRPHLGEQYLLFQSNVNVRLHIQGSKPIVGPHTDGDYKHSAWEINFWVPLTQTSGSASLWAESLPGLGDYHPFEGTYGDAFRFYGSRCLHYTKDNITDGTRVSMDFRVVRMSDFCRAGIPLTGQSKTSPWVVFGYYSIMGPDGEVGMDGWPTVASSIGLSYIGLRAVTSPRNQYSEGVIERFNPGRGFGFIEGEEIASLYGQAVFLDKSQIKDFRVGDIVSFKVLLSMDGQPLAADLQPGRLLERVDDGTSVAPTPWQGCKPESSDVKPRRRTPCAQKAEVSAAEASSDASSAQARARSTSEEHQRRCLERFGSMRAARCSCSRCGWLAHRANYLEKLVYTDANGLRKPWIAENPDLMAPWGLGCTLCHAARRQGMHEEVPCTAFSEFTFARGAPMLAVLPMVRHGNNEYKRQGAGTAYRLAHDDGHAAAVAAAANADLG
eukprot:TRINITY_DN23718_c0_g1_i3.p1 TRINITY_DN23718_c0_g1~~TRINITY_DN23718_c0_g1_i3.p1  ORF type:complete len:523 (+),score=89.89 TRINITY_DN23718_c0_g1_i3:38-1606(+)